MADDFIPLGQSTPKHGGWQSNRRNHSYPNRFQNQSRNGFNRNSGSHNRWSNSPRNNSYSGGQSNSSHSFQQEQDISAYIHPSMLQDPWAQLRNNKT